MFQELKLIFQANARIERYEVSNKFYSCGMEENSSVSEHILKMSGYHNHLTQLGINLPVDSVIDRVLQSLPPSYKSFVMNYKMQGMDKTIPELFATVTPQDRSFRCLPCFRVSLCVLFRLLHSSLHRVHCVMSFLFLNSTK